MNSLVLRAESDFKKPSKGKTVVIDVRESSELLGTPFRRECRAPVGRPGVTNYATLNNISFLTILVNREPQVGPAFRQRGDQLQRFVTDRMLDQ